MELHHISLTHNHFSSGHVSAGEPLKTKVAIIQKYDFLSKKKIWKKIIEHEYYWKGLQTETNVTEEISEDASVMLALLKKF